MPSPAGDFAASQLTPLLSPANFFKLGAKRTFVSDEQLAR